MKIPKRRQYTNIRHGSKFLLRCVVSGHATNNVATRGLVTSISTHHIRDKIHNVKSPNLSRI